MKPISDLTLPSSSVLNQSYKDRSKLSRYAKGYLYEMEMQRKLDRNGIDYDGNSEDFEKWKSETKTGYDIKIAHPKTGAWMKIECKFLMKPIWHSWFVRDWLSREADIFVTNNKSMIPNEDVELAEEYSKTIMSTYDFSVFIENMRGEGNQYVLLESSYSDNQDNVLSSRSDVRETKLTDFIGPAEAENRAETISRQVLPVLDCSNCMKRQRCSTICAMEIHRAIKPAKNAQFDLTKSISEIEEYSKNFDKRRREWLIKCGKLEDERTKCLNKRRFLQDKKGYDMFDIGKDRDVQVD